MSTLWRDPLLFIVTMSLSAWSLARWLNLSRPWLFANFTIPFAIALGLASPLASALFLLPLIALSLLYLPTFWTRVPFYPTSRKTYEIIEKALPSGPTRFLDLGSGFGTLLLYLAKRRPDSTFVGVELSILPWLVSRLRSLGRPNVEIRYQSLWSAPLDQHDVVYAFLAPPVMQRLEAKAEKEMRAGSKLMINSFPLARTAATVIDVGDSRGCRIYCYPMPGRSEGRAAKG